MTTEEPASSLRSQVLQSVRKLIALARSAEDGAARDVDERARNLARYVAIRDAGLLSTKRALRRLGLSLDDVEQDVLGTLLRTAAWLENRELPRRIREQTDSDQSYWIQQRNASGGARRPAIFVTAPTHGVSPGAVAEWLRSGASWVRINAAHGSPRDWETIAGAVAEAVRTTGINARILVDLPGPKARITPLVREPDVVKVKPERDPWGGVLAPGYTRFVAEQSPGGYLSVPPRSVCVDDRIWLESLSVGEVLEVRDERGRRRLARVVANDQGGLVVAMRKTTYLSSRSKVRRRGEDLWLDLAVTPGEPLALIRKGMRLRILKEATEVTLLDDRALNTVPATISHPSLLQGVSIGETVVFDDGRVKGRVQTVDAASVTIEVTRVRGEVVRLKGAKSLIFPARESELPLFGPVDHEALCFAARHADAIALSFARDKADVEVAIAAISGVSRDLGLIVKLETRAAAERPEAILEAAMRWPHTAVMIARGDLAATIGFREIARIQKRLTATTRAAGLPVIVATQVLDLLARKGIPSRAEIIDASVAVRSDGVMLNKGPFVAEAARTLVDLHRQGHSIV